MNLIRWPRGCRRRPVPWRRSGTPRGRSPGRTRRSNGGGRPKPARRPAIETCQARLFALRDRDGYKDHEKLALRRGHLEQEKRDLAAEQARLGRARANVSDLAAEADSGGGPAGRGRPGGRPARAPSRRDRGQFRASAGTVQPADTGDDLPVTAKARAAARRDDIREVRDHLAHVRDAERDRDSAESSLGTARQSMETCETSCREADERLAAARADLSARLEAWAGRWIGDEPYAAVTADQAELLAAALDGIGEPDAPSLAELFGTLTAERGRALTAQGQRLRTRDADLGEAAAKLASERETVAGERDDGPPASDLRPANRAERAGAPLWRLADFRPGVDAEHRRRDRRRAVRRRPAHRLGSSRSVADHGGGRRGRGRRLPGRAAACGTAGRPDAR